MSHFANTYPALEGNVVTEGHARHCRENGHATNTKLDAKARPESVAETCPRCGAFLTALELREKYRAELAAGAPGEYSAALRVALLEAWNVAVKREKAVEDVAAVRAARAEAEREAREKADAADAALTHTPAPGDVVTDEAGHFGIVTDFLSTKGRVGVMWTHEGYPVAERPSAMTVIDPAAVAAFVAGLPKSEA